MLSLPSPPLSRLARSLPTKHVVQGGPDNVLHRPQEIVSLAGGSAEREVGGRKGVRNLKTGTTALTKVPDTFVSPGCAQYNSGVCGTSGVSMWTEGSMG